LTADPSTAEPVREPAIYGELADWFPLLTPPEDYEEDAAELLRLLRASATHPIGTILELGSGGGHLASHLREASPPVRLTLVDRAPAMLAVSARLNPGVEHVLGDMFGVRLERTFDAVLVHDAASHVLAPREVDALARTCRAHLVDGGVAVACPDHVAETFVPSTEHGGGDAADGTRGLRYVQRDHDPDPSDDVYVADLEIELREHGSGGDTVRTVRDRLVMGMLPRATWTRAFVDAGFASAGWVRLAARAPVAPASYATDADGRGSWMEEVLVAVV
jgi:SAM-dependent methyltransferase